MTCIRLSVGAHRFSGVPRGRSVVLHHLYIDCDAYEFDGDLGVIQKVRALEDDTE